MFYNLVFFSHRTAFVFDGEEKKTLFILRLNRDTFDRLNYSSLKEKQPIQCDIRLDPACCALNYIPHFTLSLSLTISEPEHYSISICIHINIAVYSSDNAQAQRYANVFFSIFSALI